MSLRCRVPSARVMTIPMMGIAHVLYASLKCETDHIPLRRAQRRATAGLWQRKLSTDLGTNYADWRSLFAHRWDNSFNPFRNPLTALIDFEAQETDSRLTRRWVYSKGE